MPKIFKPFEYGMDFLWGWEGGFVNDPDDPGGATNYGITINTAIDNGMDLNGDGKVDVEDIKAMTPIAAMEVYKNKYWDAVGANDLPWDIGIVAFDTAVNCGVNRTLGWINQLKRVNKLTWKDLMAMRRIHYATIIQKNPTLRKYKQGWENRVTDLSRFIDRLKSDKENPPTS